MQLHVLPVGDVGDVAAELGADAGDRAQLVAAELTAVDAHPQHEVGVLELLRLQDGGLPAGDALRALGVEAHPAHPAAQVAGVDAVEAGVRVDVEDPLADVEPVGVLLHPLVGVQRLAVAERPLTLATLGPGAGTGRGGHGGSSSCAVHARLAGPRGGAAGSGGPRGATGDRCQRAARHTALETSARSMCRRATRRSPRSVTTPILPHPPGRCA